MNFCGLSKTNKRQYISQIKYMSSQRDYIRRFTLSFEEICYLFSLRIWEFEKSGSGCVVGTRPLFLRLSCFFGIFGVFLIMWVVMQWSERLEIWTGCTLFIFIWRSKRMFSKKLHYWGLISIIMHNLCIFCTFSTFTLKIFKGRGLNFPWSFVKVICT